MLRLKTMQRKHYCLSSMVAMSIEIIHPLNSDMENKANAYSPSTLEGMN